MHTSQIKSWNDEDDIIKTKNLNRKLAKYLHLEDCYYKISSGTKDIISIKVFKHGWKLIFTLLQIKENMQTWDYPKSFLSTYRNVFKYICEEIIRSNDDKFITADGLN